MGAFTVGTVVSRSYLPAARVLARSVRRQNPDVDMAVLVIDDRDGAIGPGEPFSVLQLRHVGLGGRTGRQMLGTYTVVEMACATKPWLVEHLVRSTGGPVIYLDADCEVHGPLTGLAEQAAEHAVAVTPHTVKTVPDDGLSIAETSILAAGVYNLGFLAVSPQAISGGFLPAWRERLVRDAVVDPSNMLFTDQRWVDFIDCFPHVVVHDPGANVAYFNVWGRSLAQAGDTTLVDGVPLTFFHFSGFDPRVPHLLSQHQGDSPRVLLSEHPVLRQLCEAYARRLLDEGYATQRALPYGWGATDRGLILDPVLRAAYRTALLAADRAGTAPPPGPFDADGGAAFARWVGRPGAATGVSRYVTTLYGTHPDLRLRFDNALENRSSAEALEGWTWESDDPRAADARRVLERRPGRPTLPPGRPGLNVVAHADDATGVARVGSLLARAAGAAGLATATGHSPLPFAGIVQDRPEPTWEYDTNVFCINADVLDQHLSALPHAVRRERRSAAVWFWETDQFPARWDHAFSLVDEVWAPSRFVARALADKGPAVRLWPVPFPIPAWSSTLTRQDLGLPEGFLVLFTFDWQSVAARKNPEGLIEAYRRAFSPDQGAHLVIKTVNGDRCRGQLEALTLAVDRPDVHLIDGRWSAAQFQAALERADCYASLHRSEGLGLGLAEAMAVGTPVVATAWSGNLEFMDDQTALLVPAEVVPIPDQVPIYGGHGHWAEPDLDAAAAALRRVRDDPTGSAARAGRARAHLAATRTLEESGRALAALAEHLRRHPDAA